MDYQAIKALVGEQSLQSAFWVMLGSLVLSNAGLIVGAILSHFRRLRRMRTDLNRAFERIRALEEKQQQGR